MGRSQLFVWLLLSAAMSLVAVVIAAAFGNHALSVVATAMFSIVAIVVSLRLSLVDCIKPERAACNARLLAILFAWGGLTILAAYYLTDLFWHHAWQYGLAMLLIAILAWVYARCAGNPDHWLATTSWLQRAAALSFVQAVAAVVGLGFLITSGKLTAGKADWVANHVFLAGGVAIIVLSLVAVRAQFRE